MINLTPLTIDSKDTVKPYFKNITNSKNLNTENKALSQTQRIFYYNNENAIQEPDGTTTSLNQTKTIIFNDRTIHEEQEF